MKTTATTDFALPEEAVGDTFLRFLRENYTEANADKINQTLVAFIPDVRVRVFGLFHLPMGTIRRAALTVLDAMTPGLALRAVEAALVRVGWATDRGPDGAARRDAWPG